MSVDVILAVDGGDIYAVGALALVLGDDAGFGDAGGFSSGGREEGGRKELVRDAEEGGKAQPTYLKTGRYGGSIMQDVIKRSRIQTKWREFDPGIHAWFILKSNVGVVAPKVSKTFDLGKQDLLRAKVFDFSGWFNGKDSSKRVQTRAAFY
ncbi:hypothetical protein BDP27DRAFT_1549514 [Rhodocollybia butyracea]|uniref:Uncharacterized protein n=1 Tax=Rhodocollybia butyracea TaxID=206335 RepID=A0A9P5U499_9AGAR|nr:hypothetical protein BDP27DRAFT_1549514 [Rhodocollybia butyracea]